MIRRFGRLDSSQPVFQLIPGKRGIMQIRRVLALCVAVASVTTSGPVFAQRNNDDNRQQQQRQPQRSPQEQQDVETLVRLVDGVSTGQQPAPTDIPVTWEANHFVKGQSGDTYIPFTLTVDRSKLTTPGVALYVRVVDKNAAAAAPAAAPAAAAEGNQNNNERDRNRDQQQAAAPARPMYAWDNIHFIDVPADGKLQRAIQLKPGQYEAFIAVKPKAAAPQGGNNNRRNNNDNAAAAAAAPARPVGLLRRELTVPDFSSPDLQTSSVILAKSVEPMQAALSPTEQESNPYVFGPMRIVPSPDGKYAKNEELSVIFWIYGAQEAAGGKPDVTIDYNFHVKQGDTEKYFNKTAPQVLNAQSLPPEFSVAAGHQLPGSLVVPLASFPAGEYRLEIKVTDKPSGKTVTQNVNFTVAG